MSTSRHLAAIMFTDIVGYTTLMGRDEQKAFECLKKNREIQKPIIEQYSGRWIKELGDGVMATFGAVSDAVTAALKIQEACKTANDFQLRIGIHLGEVVFEGDDVFGDGVNIAARIQAVAKPGSVYISESVYHNVENKKEFKTRFVKEELLKNVEKPVRIYEIVRKDDPLYEKPGFNNDGRIKSNIESSKRPTARIVTGLSLVVLAILGTYSFNRFQKPKIEVEAIDPSVAVLAFSDLSPGSDQEWFSDGLTDEILNSLANLDELKVTARTSAFFFKGKDVTLQEIAQKLRVAHVVEGSVQRIDNRLRITAQLIRAKDGFHIWSHTYDRTAEDLFQVQTDIAGNVALALLQELTPEKQKKLITRMPANIEAYKYFSKGYKAHQEKYQYTAQSGHFEDAEKNLLIAISLDPSYAEAYGALADLYDTKGNDPADKIKFWHLRDSVMQIGNRLDPNSVQTLIVYGFSLRKRDQPDLDSSYNCVKKAYHLAPNSVHAIRSMAGFYRDIGLIEKYKVYTEKALALDPLHLVSVLDLAYAQLALGTIDDAKKTLEKALELDNENISAHHLLGVISLNNGDAKEAVRRLEIMKGIKGIRPDHYRIVNLQALLLANGGQKIEALKLSRVLGVMSILGMKKEFLARLDSMSESYISTSDPANLLTDHYYDFVRNEPKFKIIFDREKKEYETKLAKYGNVE